MIRNLKIKAYQVALVFKNRNLIEILKEGNYWIFGNKSVEIYEMKNQFLAKEDLNILLKNEELASMLELVEVKDGELFLMYENGIFKDVLGVGQYAFWKVSSTENFKKLI